MRLCPSGLLPLLSAVQTVPLMNADGPAAGRTAPPLAFFLLEGCQPVIPDIFKVFQHTHSVPGPVPFIKLPESFAGVLFTFVTKSRIIRFPYFTVTDNAARYRYPLSFIHGITSRAGILLPEKGMADTAVHSAGGYKQVFQHHNPSRVFKLRDNYTETGRIIHPEKI